MDRSIQSRVKRQMERAQKEYYLNEKIKAIQKELGRGEKSEFDDLKKKIETAGMPKDVFEKAIQELKKLEAMPPMSAESTVSRNYLDWLLAVPWKKKSKETRSIDNAEKVLNEDHYGLEKIKDRILEFLAVRQLVKNPKGSILCFVGPPGVGKTSLGMSIAKATGRKFVRMSLGGVRDEAEIRGHRRTYIGALPGQIIQSMKKAGTKNPVFMLDEVDKMASDFRGDPASALLEVLDPEQNTSFQDHYLDVEYDLSRGPLRRHRERTAHDPGSAAGPHGNPAAARLHRSRKAGNRQAVSAQEAARHHRPQRQEHHLQRRCHCRDHPQLHPRGWRPQSGTRDRQCLPQGRSPRRQEWRQAQGRDHRRKRDPDSSAWPSSAIRKCTRRAKLAWSPAWRGPK